MSRFDDDTSIMQFRMAHTPIELRHPRLAPQTKAHGIVNGVMIGALLWVAIIMFGLTVYRWLNS